MSNYSELLKDPRWQEKRAWIIKNVWSECTRCGDKDHELHVHHKYYIAGKMPWDYPADCYEVLCVNCHRKHHEGNKSDHYASRPVKSIGGVMIEFLENVLKKLKGNG